MQNTQYVERDIDWTPVGNAILHAMNNALWKAVIFCSCCHFEVVAVVWRCCVVVAPFLLLPLLFLLFFLPMNKTSWLWNAVACSLFVVHWLSLLFALKTETTANVVDVYALVVAFVACQCHHHFCCCSCSLLLLTDLSKAPISRHSCYSLLLVGKSLALSFFYLLPSITNNKPSCYPLSPQTGSVPLLVEWWCTANDLTCCMHATSHWSGRASGWSSSTDGFLNENTKYSKLGWHKQNMQYT